MSEASFYKILHTTCHRGWGGLEKRIFNEAVWMREHGHQVSVVLPENTPLFDWLKSERFRVYPMEFGRLQAWKNYRRLVQICGTEMPDVLNTHGNADTKIALSAAGKARVPCRILSRHISAHVRNTWYNRRLYNQLNDYVFTTADYTRKHLQKVFGIPDIKIFSIPSGIREPENLLPCDDARMSLARELGLPLETRFIGFVGRVSKDKDPLTLIRAFREIGSRTGHHLVIVGEADPSYREILNREIKKACLEERIHFTGFREDVWPFYRAFDCLVLASRNKGGIPFEGVPQTLLEAMYSGCPVIGTRTGGIVDIIDHERTGLLCEVEDFTRLAEQILLTLTEQDSTQQRAAAARALVQEKHTVDAMGRNIIRIYSLHQVKRRREGLVAGSSDSDTWNL